MRGPLQLLSTVRCRERVWPPPPPPFELSSIPAAVHHAIHWPSACSQARSRIIAQRSSSRPHSTWGYRATAVSPRVLTAQHQHEQLTTAGMCISPSTAAPLVLQLPGGTLTCLLGWFRRALYICPLGSLVELNELLASLSFNIPKGAGNYIWQAPAVQGLLFAASYETLRRASSGCWWGVAVDKLRVY